MKRYLVLFLLLGFTAANCQMGKTGSKNPWTGTYKLDVAKSTFSGPAPKDETVVVDAADKTAVKYTIKGTDAEGNSYTISYDGKTGTASPQSMNGNAVAQVTYQMPSSHRFTSEAHSSTGPTSTGTITLSKDGKTITVQEHSTDAKGVVHDQTTVFTRQ